MEMSRSVHILVNSVLVLLVLCWDCEARDSDLSYVTCGSLVKLLNTRHNVRLHSHDVKYGSGRNPRFTRLQRTEPGRAGLNVSVPVVVVA